MLQIWANDYNYCCWVLECTGSRAYIEPSRTSLPSSLSDRAEPGSARYSTEPSRVWLGSFPVLIRVCPTNRHWWQPSLLVCIINWQCWCRFVVLTGGIDLNNTIGSTPKPTATVMYVWSLTIQDCNRQFWSEQHRWFSTWAVSPIPMITVGFLVNWLRLIFLYHYFNNLLVHII
jgi:hypothetical protein